MLQTISMIRTGLIASLLISITDGQGDCFGYKGLKGQCREYKDCPAIVNLIQKVRNLPSIPPNVREFIQQSNEACPDSPFQGSKLCCPTSLSSTTSRPQRRGGDLLPPNCGKKTYTQDRIIGGYEAALGSWPWIALLEIAGGGKCGGSLINDRYVVTAAHCVQSDVNFVVLGEHDLTSTTDCDRFKCALVAQRIAPERVIQHPDYNSPCLYCNDIALVRLSRPATLHEFVAPICLPRNPPPNLKFNFDNFNSLAAETAGWGHTDAGSRPTFGSNSNILHAVKLQVHELQYCKEQKDRFRKQGADPNSVFCAGGGNAKQKDTCQGDSGGPMTLNQYQTTYYLVGITSYSQKGYCGNQDFQGIYTKVSHFNDWIISQLRP